MKKLLSLLVVTLLTASPMFSQTWGDNILSIPKRVWTDPVIYDYDEEVTWYFDLSGEDAAIREILDDATLALWTWIPTNPGDGHFGGGYNIAQPEMILTARKGYVYSITMKPTEFYNVTKEYLSAYSAENSFVMHIRVFSKDRDADINCFAFHVKFPHFIVKDIKTEKIPHLVYPTEVNATTPIAILIDKDSIPAFTGNLYLDTKINDGAYSVIYDGANANKTKMKNYFGVNEIYVLNISNPSEYFGTAFDYRLENIEFATRTEGSQASDNFVQYPLTPVDPWGGTSLEENVAQEPVRAYILNGVLFVDALNFDLYNISGSLVARSESSSLDVSNLPSGVYIVKTSKGSSKLIK